MLGFKKAYYSIMMSHFSKKPLFMTAGEPAGIGYEITQKAVKAYQGKRPFVILADARQFSDSFSQQFDIMAHHSVSMQHAFNHNTIIDYPLPHPVRMGHPDSNNAPTILKTIYDAAAYAFYAKSAMVTAPIQKETIAVIHPSFKGHTDYIAETISEYSNKIYHPVMMLSCPELNTVPLTIHIPLKDVSHHITQENIIQTVKIIHNDFIQFYQKKPHIAITGLNPHAGDHGVMGDEEINIINPAINHLKQDYHVSGPYAADSLFHAAARKNYDVVLCMYHDQALIPVKTIGFDTGVNRTLGLPIIRTSPDHGTALNIAGKNCACHKAMLEAIETADHLLSMG